MDKEKATKLLVKELVKAKGQTFVTDTAHKKHLLEKALVYYPIECEKPFTLEFEIDFLNDSNHTLSRNKFEELMKDYKKGLISCCSKVKDANYIFVDNSQSVSIAGKYREYSCLSLMGDLSFFALIGDKETYDAPRMFYKNVDNNIARAFDTLEIKNFIYVYNTYKSENSHFVHYYRPTGKLDDFLEFIFTLPYEDQNIQINKNILQSYYNYIDFVEILTGEYSNGKYFKEYFDCLSSGNKKRVVDNLATIEKRNTINDSFLWSQGFKDLQLDHIALYKNDSSNFMEYFKKSSLEERKVILKDIMDYDSTNEEIVKWLNENYSDLIREVAINE